MARIVSFCGSAGANTGGFECDEQLTNPRKGFYGSAKFTLIEQASEATMKAALIDRIHRPNGDSEKLYPFALINGVNKTTENDAVETAPDGFKRTLKVSPESYELDQWNVGINQQAAFMALNGVTLPQFVLTDTGQLAGRFDSDGLFVGSKVQMNTKGAGLGTYANGAIVKTTVNYVDPYALTKNLAVIKFSSIDPDDYEGLVDITLSALAAPTGNAHKIGATIKNKVKGKDTNLYDIYDDELAIAGMWRGWTSAGAIVTPTTAVKDTALKGWTVTFGVAVVKYDLVTPDLLYDGSVKGVEGLAHLI